MEREYKVAVFDLDGTLTNSKKELTDRTKRAIEALQDRGVKIVLASGRPTYGIMPVARGLNLEQRGGYILAYNGGVIIDLSTGEEIYSKRLPKGLIEPLYRISKEEECVILSYRGEVIVTESPEDKYVEYEARLNAMPLEGCKSFVGEFDYDVPKCLAVGDPERAAALVERLRGLYGEQMSIYRSEPFFVELVPLNVDKAESLQRLADYLGLSSDDMVSFGDGFNDLSMIEWAGCGVAMANAQSEVKERANYVTLTNDEDGVAEFIERELL